MSTSPERCLGGLLKDINEDVVLDEFNSISKDLISKISSSQKLSLDSIYSFKSSTSASSLTYTISKASILKAFNNQQDTILLQKMLMEAPNETLSQIIKEMNGSFSLVIKNKNGNYFCSDLLKSCDQNQRIIILKELSITLCDDCLDEYGTHTIQTLIENSKSKEEYDLILASFNTCDKISKASKNSNGFFVIQKIINYIPENMRMEFNYLFLKLFYELSIDIYGISTVKAFILYTKNEEILKQIEVITYNNFLNIAKNQYGNYLIQSMQEHWGNSKSGIKLKKMIIANFNILMENHYSKFICNLFINRADIEEKKMVLSILLKNKQNVNILNNNKKSKDNKKNPNLKEKSGTNEKTNELNDKLGVNNKQNINKSIYSPLSNDAKPFYPKSKKENK